jgi:undecaprenyl-diphosphatase
MIILGIVEGATEFLPVSSTAHLILTNALLGTDLTSPATKVFEIGIQLGAVAAIPIYYHKAFRNIHTLEAIVAAFIPTAIIGLLVKHFSLGLMENLTVIAWALILGGIALIGIEYWVAQRKNMPLRAITPKNAVIIGTAQALALIPGVSRSGATIAAGLLMDIPRAAIAEFSFLLSVPTIAAATCLGLISNRAALDASYLPQLLLGMAVSCVVALIVIKAFMSIIRRYSFIPFGVYRIIIGLLVLFFFV